MFDAVRKGSQDRCLRRLARSSSEFSKSALRGRKDDSGEPPPRWLDGSLADAYEPTADDFRRLRKHVAKERSVYESRYRDVRDKVFAHRGVMADELTPVADKADINEFKRLTGSLLSHVTAVVSICVNRQNLSYARVRWTTRTTARTRRSWRRPKPSCGHWRRAAVPPAKQTPNKPFCGFVSLRLRVCRTNEGRQTNGFLAGKWRKVVARPARLRKCVALASARSDGLPTVARESHSASEGWRARPELNRRPPA